MALEQLSLAAARSPVDADSDAVINGRPASIDGGEDGSKAPRLPRWTRQEILVLIQGKRVAENRVRRGRTTGMAFGSAQVEPKWASVSSYCKRHGVNRGPVQCRKRWSNLAGDFKKIKEWESQIREETESFWVMRNDLRRERKLPGFFDKEVYDILDGGQAAPAATGLDLALAPSSAHVEPIDAPEISDAVFDSGRSAAAEDGLFSDFEQEEAGASPEKEAATACKPVPAPSPISEKLYQPVQRECAGQDTTNEKQQATNPEIGSTSHDVRKRKRLAPYGEEETSILQSQLIDVLERNGKMLTAQLEAQNTNFQMDRVQRKDHGDSLVAVLNKLAEALGRIADKL
ncbi:Myb_DNA-bind_4 domain-containing protein [Cephalotus follicularis]|uniref:Myb_DNA-bind_4 domain-containing protein n=1 Tax=Cephalotus follicularis TaxID=3775 RepID=A0A1Q3BVU8_CEPFO|nr:Myb_DNA-bind_4 domain-containing protein [Cephalotus follicularis]